MVYPDMRGFTSEFTYVAESRKVEVEKLGGGVLGKTYEGKWRYKVYDLKGELLAEGRDMYSERPVSHREMALAVLDFGKAFGEW
jgi:hypothetical protein